MDLLAKLKKLDPSAVTPEEESTGVTKLRYMSHREVMSSTRYVGADLSKMNLSHASFNDLETVAL